MADKKAPVFTFGQGGDAPKFNFGGSAGDANTIPVSVAAIHQPLMDCGLLLSPWYLQMSAHHDKRLN